jgi:hypothetical protein
VRDPALSSLHFANYSTILTHKSFVQQEVPVKTVGYSFTSVFVAMASAANDNIALIKGVTWSLLVFSAVFLSLRLYCKRLNRGRGWHWDDLVLVASWVCFGSAPWCLQGEELSESVIF